jgi:hypothetical protein
MKKPPANSSCYDNFFDIPSAVQTKRGSLTTFITLITSLLILFPNESPLLKPHHNMNTISKTLRSLNLMKIVIHSIGMGGLLTLLSCNACGDPMVPDSHFLIITHFTNSAGEDLLNPGVKDSFRKEDLKVVSAVEVNGQRKETIYSWDEKGIEVNTDRDGKNFIRLALPTNAYSKPIATYVTLSPADTDTVTYTFESAKYKNLPDKIYYNNKLVWNINDTPEGSNWNPITIIK